MKTLLYAAALTAILLAVPAAAETPQVKPYAAGSPSGGIPLGNRGEKFVAIAGGSCNGTCPVYELYVFDDGRVIFSYEGCVECGTCRIVCNEFRNIEWTYPRGGYGIQYRYG